jgi:molybdenum cofactor cytidylyltransferase
MTASSYADRKGVPAYFPRKMFSALLSLKGDAGARDLLKSAVAIDLKGGEVDIDTAEDLERAKWQ